MTPELYVYLIAARRREGDRTNNRRMAGISVNASQSEAVGAALLLARETWPIAEEWTSHDASAVCVPRQIRSGDYIVTISIERTEAR